MKRASMSVSLNSMAAPVSGILPLRTALVDPDATARERLRQLLFAHPSVEVTGAADTLEEVDWTGIRLLFCGLARDAAGVLARLGERPSNVDVILVSSDEKWAAGAFEADALDFLVKPVEKERLSRAIRRLLRLDWAAGAREVESGKQVFVPFERGRRLVSTSEICAIQAIGNYTQVRLAGGATEIVMRPLRRWEESLAPGTFLRLHRSTLANVRRIRRIEMAGDGDGALAELEGLPDPLLVSRRLLPAVRAALRAVHPQ